MTLSERNLVALTDLGATLHRRSGDGLPDRFDLYFTSDGKVGRICEVVARTDAGIELRFLGRSAPPPRGLPAQAAEQDEPAGGGKPGGEVFEI